MNSHAQVPTTLVLEDRIRIYFATRPQSGVSLTGFVDLDIERPNHILTVSERPVLELGGPGAFDEHGIMPSAAIRVGERIRLYYSGWCRLAGRAPYHNSTGVAVSEDGGLTFRRECEGPVLDRSAYEPFSATSPWILQHEGRWHAFYSAGLGWIEVDKQFEHVYDIRHATSKDGISWKRSKQPSICQNFEEEAITRPTILKQNDGTWEMWFCYRGTRDFRSGIGSYRIGFARSSNLWDWQRDDQGARIDISESGLDSESIAYPCVIKIGSRILMFYNGNNFGREGFAWAEWGE